MKPLICILLLVHLLAGFASAKDISLLKYTRRLDPPPSAGRTLGSFNLDEPLLDATREGYPDIRIMNDDGVETPFLVRVQRQLKTVAREDSFSMKALAFEEKPDNRIEIVVERENDDPAPSALVLETRLRNYEKQVSVFGSNDSSAWQPLAVDQPIFDYSRFFDLRNNRVDLRAAAFRFYKIEVRKISESHQSPLVRIARERRDESIISEIEKTSFTRMDFKIDSLRFVHRSVDEVRSETVTRNYPVRNVAVREDAENQETVIAFEACRAPITKVSIVTPNVNFSREVIVEAGSIASSGKTNWQVVCSGRISRIDLGTFKRDSVELSFPGARRMKTVRLRIKNHDSPPLEITGARTEGSVMELVFLKEPSGRYHVFYGGENVPQPRYDILEVLRNAETATTDIYTPSLQANNPEYAGPASRVGFNSRALLIAAVVLMVIVLGLTLARAAKRVESPTGI